LEVALGVSGISQRSGEPLLVITVDPAKCSVERTSAALDRVDPKHRLAILLVEPQGAACPGKDSGRDVQTVRVAGTARPSDWGLAEGWDQWYLFDSEGADRYSGQMPLDGLPAAVDVLLNGGDLPRSRALRDLTSFVQGVRPFSEDHDVHVALLLERANANCPSGVVLAALREAVERYGGLDAVVAVPAEWSDTDVASFADSVARGLRIVRLDRETTAQWSQLGDIDGKSLVEGALAIFQESSAPRIIIDPHAAVAYLRSARGAA
jgi:hypothetical protein